MTSYDDRQYKYITTGMDFVDTVAQRIMENLEGEEQDTEVNKMREIMLQYIRMEIEYKAGREVLERLKKGLDSEQIKMDTDIEAEYKAKLAEELAGRSAELVEDELRKHVRFQRLEKCTKGKGEDDEMEDDVVTGPTIETFIDPWSKMAIKDPVRNKVCGHIYDRSVAQRMISKEKGKKPVKCPYMGCNNRSLRGDQDLLDDPETKRKIEEMARSK